MMHQSNPHQVRAELFLAYGGHSWEADELDYVDVPPK